MARIALNAKLYRNTGSYGTPTWTLVPEVHNLTVSDSMGEGDVSTRGAGVKQFVPCMRDISLEFDTPNIASNANVIALREAYAARTLIDVAVMDDAIATTGAHGIRFEAYLFKRDRAEELENPQMLSWTVKPGYSTNAPADMLTA